MPCIHDVSMLVKCRECAMTAPGEFARLTVSGRLVNLNVAGEELAPSYFDDFIEGVERLRANAEAINAAVAAHVQKAVKEAITCRVCGNNDSVCSSNWTREVRRAVEEFRARAVKDLEEYGEAMLQLSVTKHADKMDAVCETVDDCAEIIRALPLSPAEARAENDA